MITTTLLHSDDPLTVKRLGRLAAWRFRAYRSADRYVAICPALRDTYSPAGIPLERVAHIPVGVDVERFRPRKKKAKVELATYPGGHGWRGNVYGNLGLYGEAEPLLRRSLELRRELYGDDHPAEEREPPFRNRPGPPLRRASPGDAPATGGFPADGR